MEKKKNDTLPDEVLFINQGNLAYLRGDSKDLANKEELFKNIAWSAGSSSEPDAKIRLLFGIFMLFGGGFYFFCGIIPLYLYITDLPSDVALSTVLTIIIFILMSIIGIGGLYLAMRISIYRPEKIQKLYTKLIQHGQICSGYVTNIRYRHLHIHYSFTTPAGKRISGIYSTNLDTVLYVREGAPIVVLYLNEKTHILL